MTAAKQPVSVLVVIHTADLDVLLLERASHPGYWQSVTGSREGEETLVATAWRELAEETGISTGELSDWSIRNSYDIFPEWRHRYAPGVTRNVEHVFGLRLPSKPEIKIAPAEHLDWCWLPWEEAAERCFSWSNRDAIRLLPMLST